LKTHLKQGLDVAFTIDGPRGPIFRVKPGPVWLARKTGHPLLCLHAEPGKFWTLKSWDSFRIPKPFSEVFMVLGEPLYLDENITPETGLEMYQKKMDELKSICEPSD
jgi:lysophospholipid acyltransferase (LPLAT)-like uncharacterized protein